MAKSGFKWLASSGSTAHAHGRHLIAPLQQVPPPLDERPLLEVSITLQEQGEVGVGVRGGETAHDGAINLHLSALQRARRSRTLAPAQSSGSVPSKSLASPS